MGDFLGTVSGGISLERKWGIFFYLYVGYFLWTASGGFSKDSVGGGVFLGL